MADSGFNRKWRNYQAWALQGADQAVQEFKLKYEQWTPEQRSEFRAIASELADIAERLERFCGYMSLEIGTYEQDRDQETGAIDYEGFGRLAPDVVLSAIEAWERGEEFAPVRV